MSTTMQAVPRPRGAAGTLVRAVLILLRARAIVVLVALLVLFSSLAPEFLTANNLSILTKHVAITALLISNGKTFPGLGGEASRGNTGFPAFGQSFILHIPSPVWMMAVLFVIAWVVAIKTPFGRHIYAVGGNDRAARLAGIRVPAVKIATYVISAFTAALVGLIIASQLEAAHPATGETFELNAIAAVVLGGTSLMGGRGSVTGSLIGAFVIGILTDGLVMLGVSEFWQMVIKGLVIVLAVGMDQAQIRLQAKLLPYLQAGR